MPDLFSDMPWSSPELWTQTVARLDQLGVSWGALEPNFDIDEWADVEQLREKLTEPRYQANEWDELRWFAAEMKKL